MLELGVTSLEEGAVAEAEAGSDRASSAADTRRKSPMEMERRVAGDTMASRAEAEVDGGRVRERRASSGLDEEEEEEAEGAPGGVM